MAALPIPNASTARPSRFQCCSKRWAYKQLEASAAIMRILRESAEGIFNNSLSQLKRFKSITAADDHGPVFANRIQERRRFIQKRIALFQAVGLMFQRKIAVVPLARFCEEVHLTGLKIDR